MQEKVNKNFSIGIATVCYNGYGRFIEPFLEAIDKMTVRPDKITIVLGDNPGKMMTFIPNYVHLVHASGTDLGQLKNIAVEHTHTEWIIPMSIDDILLPTAIEEFEKLADKSDVIIPAFEQRYKNEVGIFAPKRVHEYVCSTKFMLAPHSNFFHGSSPYRRSIWEKHHYHEGDCQNALFWIDCMLDNPRIAYTDTPCLVYIRRADGHSCVEPHIRKQRANIIRYYRRDERLAWTHEFNKRK